MADRTWATKRMMRPMLNGGSPCFVSVVFSCRASVMAVYIGSANHTFDWTSDHAAIMTPTVRSNTEMICMRENRFPNIYPIAMVVMLPPERSIICIGTEIL